MALSWRFHGPLSSAFLLTSESISYFGAATFSWRKTTCVSRFSSSQTSNKFSPTVLPALCNLPPPIPDIGRPGLFRVIYFVDHPFPRRGKQFRTLTKRWSVPQFCQFIFFTRSGPLAKIKFALSPYSSSACKTFCLAQEQCANISKPTRFHCPAGIFIKLHFYFSSFISPELLLLPDLLFRNKTLSLTALSIFFILVTVLRKISV